MFTGIIEEIGQIVKIEKGFESMMIHVSCKKILKDIKTGDSVSVNGCCLTASRLSDNGFSSDLSAATVAATTFKDIKINGFVNLEGALKPSDRLGGHFVTGHIDGTVRLNSIEPAGTAQKLKIRFPENLSPYIVPKGSVSLDGISLTVAESGPKLFTVFIIPHTLNATTLKFKKIGDLLNFEADLIARYIRNHLISDNPEYAEKEKTAKDNILKEKLIKYGFIR